MQIIAQLKQFDADRETLEESVFMLAIAKAARAEFATHEIDPPEWLPNTMNALQASVLQRSRADLERKVRELELRRDRLKTREEQRVDTDKEIERLKAKLNPQAVTA